MEPVCSENCPSENECSPQNITQSPLLSVLDNRKLYEFIYEGQISKSCNETLVGFKRLFEGQDNICIYAAHLQEEPVSPEDQFTRHSIWIIDHLKTYSGQWPEP